MRKIDETAFVADGARIIKNVVLEKNSSVWFNSVLRGDGGQIIVGENSNIQDGCVVHAEEDEPTILAKDVTVGHMTLLHGCRIGENSLIGMGSIVMNGAVIGRDCIIGAGSLITFGTVIPDGSLAYGRPTKVVRKLTEQEIRDIGKDVRFYLQESAKYKNEQDRAKM